MAERDQSNGAPSDHAAHDPELIAGLLDRDLDAAGRAGAEAWLDTCAVCAALHRDLVDLASATIAAPVPSRTRDFALSPDVAATLRQAAAGEPVPVRTRLSGEMTESRTLHAIHDRLLIANLIDRSVSDVDRAMAQAQMAACSACATLHDDLLALSATTRAMPVPARPRDFTLTQADADRLRIPGWRRLLSAIGSPRDVFSRPLALGLTTLGIAGLLVATIPSALPGFGGGATSLSSVEDPARIAGDAAGGAAANPEFAPQASAAPAATNDSGPAMAATAPTSAPSAAAAPAPAASAEAPPEVLAEGGDSNPLAGEPENPGAFDYFTGLGEVEAGGPSPLFLAALVLLLIGLMLFGLRWTARRLGDG